MVVEKWTVEEIPDLAGKVGIVTGSNIGIGLAITKELAKKGCEVVMACRNMEKAEKAKADLLNELGPEAKLVTMKVDVSSIASVKEFASEFKKNHTKLDLLMENAGVMALHPRQVSVDGNELQFATNHLGHFVLTGELLPLMENTPGSRIVIQSSSAHWMGKFHWDDLQAEKKYCRYEQYAMTKLANVAFTKELEKRLTKAHISSPTVYAVHPGVVEDGQLFEHASASALESFVNKLVSKVVGVNDFAHAALPALFCLTSPEATPGKFYGPDGLLLRGTFKGEHPKERKVNKIADDPEATRRLWEESEKITHYNFNVASS